MRESWPKGKPIGCVAFKIKSDTVIEYETSAHNPRDQYSKKLAREIASGRLAAAPIVIDATNEKNSTHHVVFDHVGGVIERIVMNISNSVKQGTHWRTAPNGFARLERSARKWLKLSSEYNEPV
jgi:hypothetical protein